MNKKETKRYDSIRKFLSGLTSRFDDADLEVYYDGARFDSITFDDNNGKVQFHSDKITQCVYDSWEMSYMTIKEIKDELKDRIIVMKKFEFWK